MFFDTAPERDRAAIELHARFPQLSIATINVPDEDWAARVCSPDAYGALLDRAGFSRVDVTDITSEGLRSYLRFMFARVHDDWLAGVCDFVSLHAALRLLHRIAANHR